MKIEIRSNDCAVISGYVNAVERRSKVLMRPGAPPFREIVKPGTFRKALDRGNPVELKLNHQRTLCDTGSGLELREDNVGLYASAVVTDRETVDAAREDSGKYGEWFKKGTKSPQPGDYIMFRYSNYLVPIDKYSASHVGIVEKVNGGVITTIEGNVDGWGSDWAGTSSCKRKTRYLSSGDVYAFYRPNWQGESKPDSGGSETTVKPQSNAIDITYQVHTAGGSWLPNVKKTADYAGLENRPIDGIKANVSKGHIRYRVKLVGGTWLPWVTDREDYAGIYGRQIDCIQMGLTGVSGYQVEYRVSTANSTGYLP